MEEKFVQSRIDCLGKIEENIVFKTKIQSCKASQKCGASLFFEKILKYVIILLGVFWK